MKLNATMLARTPKGPHPFARVLVNPSRTALAGAQLARLMLPRRPEVEDTLIFERFSRCSGWVHTALSIIILIAKCILSANKILYHCIIHQVTTLED